MKSGSNGKPGRKRRKIGFFVVKNLNRRLGSSRRCKNRKRERRIFKNQGESFGQCQGSLKPDGPEFC
jgi:hypothetical protein